MTSSSAATPGQERRSSPNASQATRRVDDTVKWMGCWATPLAMVLFCLWELPTGTVNWLQLVALALSSISSWGGQRGSLRVRTRVSIVSLVWTTVFALGTLSQPTALGLLFAVAVVAGSFVLSPERVMWSSLASAALYAGVALARSTSPSRSAVWLGAAFIALIGGGVALIIAQDQTHRAELSEQISALRRQIFEQSILLEINRSVHNLQVGNTLQTVVDVTTKVMGAERTALLVAEPGDRLNLEESAFSVHFVPGQPLAAWAALNQERFASILSSNRPVFVEGGFGQGKASILAIPLHGSEGPIGVLAFDYDVTAPVGPHDEEMLKNLAQIAVLAIENGRLHARVQRMADHDGLTDIYNHRYFQERLRQELAQAAAATQMLALVMLEVDKFKAYNDRYGHQAGDSILKSIAAALDGSAQVGHGVAARYGGDEFVVILPGHDPAAALGVARRLLAEITRGTASTVYALGLPSVTVSVGLAVFPGDGSDASALIDAADRAMYCAKQQGGGIICSASV
jgi:diguanylate cyclase (GGDEF)-like protein